MTEPHHLTAYSLDDLKTVDDALLLLEKNLESLMEMMPNNRSFSAEEKAILFSNIDFVKRYYEKTELLLQSF